MAWPELGSIEKVFTDCTWSLSCPQTQTSSSSPRQGLQWQVTEHYSLNLELSLHLGFRLGRIDNAASLGGFYTTVHASRASPGKRG